VSQPPEPKERQFKSSFLNKASNLKNLIERQKESLPEKLKTMGVKPHETKNVTKRNAELRKI